MEANQQLPVQQQKQAQLARILLKLRKAEANKKFPKNDYRNI